jgi:hypothetical protein
VGPVAPVDDAVPAGPVAPVGPVEPVGPVAPVIPVAPVAPCVKYGRLTQLVEPSPIFILLVSDSMASSPAARIGLYEVQLAAVSLRNWIWTAMANQLLC